MSGPELIVSRSAEKFLPLFRGIPELGDPFLLSMLHWCRIGKRSTELKYWEVYITRQSNQSVAVSGLYQRPETAPSDAWLGWFGVVIEKRRKGVGSWCLRATQDKAEQQAISRLLVYCDASASAVHSFYRQHGFKLVGLASKHFEGATATPNDLVFAKSLVTR